MAGKKTEAELRELTSKVVEPYLQLLAFPSRTYYEESHIDPDFVREIKRTSKVLYSSKVA